MFHVHDSDKSYRKLSIPKRKRKKTCQRLYHMYISFLDDLTNEDSCSLTVKATNSVSYDGKNLWTVSSLHSVLNSTRTYHIRKDNGMYSKHHNQTFFKCLMNLNFVFEWFFRKSQCYRIGKLWLLWANRNISKFILFSSQLYKMFILYLTPANFAICPPSFLYP